MPDHKTASAVSFTVPGKPHAKARPWATSVNGRAHVYTPKGTVTYEATVRSAAHNALSGRPPFAGAVDLDIRIRLAPPKSTSGVRMSAMLSGRLKPTKRPDADNVLKAVVDGCNGVLYRDDANLTKITVEKIYASEAGVDVCARSAD